MMRDFALALFATLFAGTIIIGGARLLGLH